MRILAFEGYDAGSHRAVRESISRHGRHEWTWCTLRGRAWPWRLRLGAVQLMSRVPSEVEPFDAVFATSLVSLADLRALLSQADRVERRAPFIFYMHENQAAYPHSDAAPDPTRRDVQPALTNLTSLLAADRVLWNSAWNLESFITGMRAIMAHAPRETRELDWEHRVRAGSVIAWPPVEPPPAYVKRETGDHGSEIRDQESEQRTGNRVVWPHRWEDDKGPDELLDLARRWTHELGLRWTILGGEPGGDTHPAMRVFEREFRSSIDRFGYAADRDEYWRCLSSCDWVLSTARHEFFGIAVAEAMLAGCLPWLPDRLSYPEITPPGVVGRLGPNAPPAPGQARVIRADCDRHLAPALAVRSVGNIEGALEEAVRAVARD